jgi:hypothetical protein
VQKAESLVSEESTGTATPPWLPPQHGVRLPRRVTNPPPDDAPATSPTAILTPTRVPRSPTTSSPVLLETRPASPPRPRSQLRDRRTSRQERRAAAGPYSQCRGQRSQQGSPSVNPRGLMRTSPVSPPSVCRAATRPQDHFLPASWPNRVLQLRAQYNPTGVGFPVVSHFGWCDCSAPC